MGPLTPRAIALMFAVQTLAGILILVVACIAIGKAAELSTDGVRTRGTVVGFVSNRSCRSAEVRFQDRRGGTHQFNDDCPTSRKDGETVSVVYVRDRPTRAAVEGEVWNAPIFLSLIGLGLLGACALLVLKARRAK